MRLAELGLAYELLAPKPLYSKQVVDFVLLDVLAGTGRRGTVVKTMIKNIYIDGRFLPLKRGLGDKESGPAEFAQVFGFGCD